MAVTGRFVALVAFGIVPIVVLGVLTGDAAPAFIAWLVLAAALGSLDLVVAGSPRDIVLQRQLPSRVRLGDSATSTLFLTNRGGRRVVPWHASRSNGRRHLARIRGGSRTRCPARGP